MRQFNVRVCHILDALLIRAFGHDPTVEINEKGLLLIMVGAAVVFGFMLLYALGTLPYNDAAPNSFLLRVFGIYVLFAAIFTFFYPGWLKIAHTSRVAAGGIVLLVLAFLT